LVVGLVVVVVAVLPSSCRGLLNGFQE
jgi:hypothetical protein